MKRSGWTSVGVVVLISLTYYGLGKYDAYNYQKGVEKAKADRAKQESSPCYVGPPSSQTVSECLSEEQAKDSWSMWQEAQKWLVASYFHVHLSRVDDSHYLTDSRNDCDRELKDVYVLVKFMDAKGRRIGVGNWEAHYVAKGEHLYRTLPTQIDTPFSKVQVRLITDDALEGAK